jgi:uncharacterized protein (TIGR02145 family)
MITFSLRFVQISSKKGKMQKKIIELAVVVLILTGLSSCQSDSIKDADGNTYKTVKIGTQVWTATNLKTTKLNDGSEIPLVTDNDEWAKLTTPAYSWYNNDKSENKNTYGALYNFYAVDTKKLCPTGWHVSSDPEWEALSSFLQGVKVGGKLKEEGTDHWKSPNTEATNASGFTALPGGYRSFEGVFNYTGISGYWWSSTPYNESSVLFWNLRFRYSNTFKFRSEKNCGFSVRCVKD